METEEGCSALLAVLVEPSTSLSSSGMVIITILAPDISGKVQSLMSYCGFVSREGFTTGRLKSGGVLKPGLSTRLLTLVRGLGVDLYQEGKIGTLSFRRSSNAIRKW